MDTERTKRARTRLKSATAMLADLGGDFPLLDQYRADALSAFDDVLALVESQQRVIEAARAVSGNANALTLKQLDAALAALVVEGDE